MTSGPFNSELGGKLIMDHLSKQVFPVMKEIQQLSLDVSNYKQGFLNSFCRSPLSRLQEKYRIVNRKFLQAYHTYQTPDELFKGAPLDPEKDAQKEATMIMDYFNSKNAVMTHFQEGFNLLEIMDRYLTRCSQSADQRVSIFLSILAITISIVLALLKI